MNHTKILPRLPLVLGMRSLHLVKWRSGCSKTMHACLAALRI